jgi:hypothetical protein
MKIFKIKDLKGFTNPIFIRSHLQIIYGGLSMLADSHKDVKGILLSTENRNMYWKTNAFRSVEILKNFQVIINSTIEQYLM